MDEEKRSQDKALCNQAWWCTPVIPTLRRLRQEDFKFMARLGQLHREIWGRERMFLFSKPKQRSYAEPSSDYVLDFQLSKQQTQCIQFCFPGYTAQALPNISFTSVSLTPHALTYQLTLEKKQAGVRCQSPLGPDLTLWSFHFKTERTEGLGEIQSSSESGTGGSQCKGSQTGTQIET